MKNGVYSVWTPEKINAMVEARGACRGHVAILALCDVGDKKPSNDGFSATVSVPETNTRDAIKSLKSSLCQNVGIYAIMPSCNPGKIVEAIRETLDFGMDRQIVDLNGIRFYDTDVDNALSNIRKYAWDLFAEQWPATILDEWGENSD